uniref:Uncharacterized protein n=1 Tax=Takifugu rubripes TaxID=31033 RepID=A0A674MW54_TAKRU
MSSSRMEIYTSSDTDNLEPVLNSASVAILTILQDDDAGTSVLEEVVVLEGEIVLHDIPDLSTALAYLFGLLYALNIDYPKQTRHTFEAIQAIFFELGGSRLKIVCLFNKNICVW